MYVKPLGALDLDLSDLRSVLQKTFQVEAILLAREQLPAKARNPYRRQYWSAAVMVPFLTGPFPLLLVCDADIYTPGLASVFGEALSVEACAVVSVRRLKKGATPERLRARLNACAVHETGHILGFEHCLNDCAMRPAASLQDLDARPLLLCDACTAASPSQVKPPPRGPLRFIYSPGYTMDLGEHPFPVMKYQKLRSRLESKGAVNFFDPAPLEPEDLLRVHSEAYLDDLNALRSTSRTETSEVPLTRGVRDAQMLASGGTLQAARDAIQYGVGFNVGGGFHHAFSDRAEGFCYYNDVAIAIRCLQADGIQRALVIDCDVHQGNGTAALFEHDETVFTFSIHQQDLYPEVKEKSSLDIELPDRAGDALYMSRLRQTIPSILAFFQPDVVFYLAGADPYEDDRLGGLALTTAGLLERDELVLGQCFSRGLPVAVTLAGGYANREEDAVTIHFNTCMAALKLFGTA